MGYRIFGFQVSSVFRNALKVLVQRVKHLHFICQAQGSWSMQRYYGLSTAYYVPLNKTMTSFAFRTYVKKTVECRIIKKNVTCEAGLLPSQELLQPAKCESKSAHKNMRLNILPGLAVRFVLKASMTAKIDRDVG